MQFAASLGTQARQQPEIVSVGIAVVPGYRNPLRGVSGLIPERIDEGVDFGGSGPVYALGDAVITNATGNSAGWPGGGWITYQLTDGPDAGLMVYVAEDVTPAVQVGQHVSAVDRDRQYVRRKRWHRDRMGAAKRPVRGIAASRSRGHQRGWPVPDQDRG